jgi:hypothetical protein
VDTKRYMCGVVSLAWEKKRAATTAGLMILLFGSSWHCIRYLGTGVLMFDISFRVPICNISLLLHRIVLSEQKVCDCVNRCISLLRINGASNMHVSSFSFQLHSTVLATGISSS